MDKPRGLVVITLTLSLFPLLAAWGWAGDYRHVLYGRARLVAAAAPNVLILRMVDRDETVTVRLLGVGSPRNRDRVKDLRPEVSSFIANNNLWEASRSFVHSLLQRNVVEVRTRRWDRFDEKGRLLAYVQIPHLIEPVDVNGEIIRNGMGFVTRDYVHVTFAEYKRLEEQARHNRRGLWKSLTSSHTSALSGE
jgi:endonuclease YncB( thermonuclease family)